jgi:hypothetical protein
MPLRGPSCKGFLSFFLVHVDVEAEMAEAKGWFHMVLQLSDNQTCIEKVLPDLPAKKQAGMPSFLGKEEIIKVR